VPISSSERTTRYTKIVAVLLILFGIALRLRTYLVGRSFWDDEIAIALNIRFRGFLALMHRLDFEQTMPIPLLLLNKLVVTLFGPSEFAFRLAALLIGCCMLFVCWVVFRRLFGNRVALIAVAITVICRPFIYYSSELKQYGLDALITVLTLWFVFRVLQEERLWPRLLLWGILALLLSQPAIFLLCAAGLVMVLDQRFRTSRPWRRYTIGAGIAWGGTFVALYFLSYRDVSHSAYMRAFWSYSFLYPTSSAFWGQLRDAIYTLLAAQSFDYIRTALLAGLFAVGLYGIRRKYGWEAMTLASLPFLEVLTAAACKQYPVAMRLVLFILPLTFWVYATGVITLADLLRPRLRPFAAAALSLALLGPATVATIRYVVHFPQREANRQTVAYIKAVAPTAPVYIAFDEYLQWAYYGDDWKDPQELRHKLAAAFHSRERVEFTSPATNPEPTEIVGKVPPPSGGPLGDRQWARQEAQTILELPEPEVWVFVPVYNDDPVLGHTFRQRQLLETLQDELKRGGARLMRNYVNGDSRVFLYNVAVSRASLHPNPDLRSRRTGSRRPNL